LKDLKKLIYLPTHSPIEVDKSGQKRRFKTTVVNGNVSLSSTRDENLNAKCKQSQWCQWHL